MSAATTPRQHIRLLCRAEAFISSFEDDDTQEGVKPLLRDLRLAILQDSTRRRKELRNAKRNAVRSFVFYSLDMGAALIGYLYGFGIQVANWPVLLASMLGMRWVMHVMINAWAYKAAQEQVAAEAQGDAP